MQSHCIANASSMPKFAAKSPDQQMHTKILLMNGYGVLPYFYSTYVYFKKSILLFSENKLPNISELLSVSKEEIFIQLQETVDSISVYRLFLFVLDGHETYYTGGNKDTTPDYFHFGTQDHVSLEKGDQCCLTAREPQSGSSDLLTHDTSHYVMGNTAQEADEMQVKSDHNDRYENQQSQDRRGHDEGSKIHPIMPYDGSSISQNMPDTGPPKPTVISHLDCFSGADPLTPILSLEDQTNAVDNAIPYPFINGVSDQPNILLCNSKSSFECESRGSADIISLPVLLEDELKEIHHAHIQDLVDNCNNNQKKEDNTHESNDSHLHFKCKPGDVIGAGRNITSTDNAPSYLIVSPLDEGQSSRVWLAERIHSIEGVEEHSSQSPHHVAIKILKKGTIFEDSMHFEKCIIEYLTTEIKDQVGVCNNRNIIRLLDHFIEPVSETDSDRSENIGHDDSCVGHGCLVFEWHGGPVDSLFQVTNYTGVNPNVAKRLTRNIFRIAALLTEKAIIHTDLKPENLLFANPGILSHDIMRHTVVTTKCNVACGESLPLIPVFRRVFSKCTLSDSEETRASCSNVISNTYYIDEDPLRLVLIDFGLSYFEPLEVRVPLSFTHPNHTALVSKVTTAIDDDGYRSSRTLESTGPSDWELQRGRWDNGTCGAVDDPVSPYTKEQQMLLELSNYTKGVEIQTREYRCPEIILGRSYNSRADVWSAACITFELITGKFLFDSKSYIPDDGTVDNEDASPDTSRLHHDIIHLQLISQVIGQCKAMSNTGAAGVHEHKYYIAREGSDKLEFLYRYTPIGSLLPASQDDMSGNIIIRRNLEEELVPFLGESDAKLCNDFLMKCLTWDPNGRFSPHSMLNHPWLKGA